MPDIYEIAHAFKADRLASERQAAGALVQAYGNAWKRIRFQLDRLTAQIQELRAAGHEVSQAWLYREERLQTLKAQTEAEILHFARNAEASVTAQQREAVDAAQGEALQLVLAQLGPPAAEAAMITHNWTRVPLEATSNLVGTLQKGPLKALLDAMPQSAGEAVAQALKTGVITGAGPRKIAAEVKHALGGNLVRALTISRTEVLRSYRTASIQSYRENDGIVDGWIWMASMSKRTCAACLAMSGTVHKLGEEFGSHPNCRCTPVPHTKPIEELGDEEGSSSTQAEAPDGKAWFAQQPPAEQEQILGQGKYAAYKAGLITLDDLVGYKESPKWGPERFEQSLAKAIAAAQAQGRGK